MRTDCSYLREKVLRMFELQVFLSQLVVELAKQSHSAVDPVVGWTVDGNVDVQHEVGAVSGRRERSASRTRLVRWTAVRSALLELRLLTRLQPDLQWINAHIKLGYILYIMYNHAH